MSDSRPTGAAPEPPGTRRGVTGVELHVVEVELSLAFYEALGFRVVRRQEDWIRLDRDGAELVLIGDAHMRGRDHYFTPYLDRAPRGVGVEITVEVGDVDAVYAAAQAAGLRIVKALQDRPWKARDFRLADPDGYFLQITTPI